MEQSYILRCLILECLGVLNLQTQFQDEVLAGDIIRHPQQHPFVNKRDLDAGAREIEKVLPVGAHVTIFGELAHSMHREVRHGHPYFIRPDR